jgi:hypothetical protein
MRHVRKSPAFKLSSGPAETDFVRLRLRSGRLWRGLVRGQAGESLTEAVLAMVVFMIAAVALSGTLTASVSVHRIAHLRTTAEQQALSQIETIRRLPYDSVGIVNGNPSGVLAATSTTTLAGESVTVTTSVTFVADPTPTSYNTLANYKKVVVTITRTSDSKLFARQVTFVAPPGQVGGALANISAQIQDLDANPVAGIGVALGTGPRAPRTDTTDSTGTVSFVALTANPTSGSGAYYDLTVSPPGGYVNLADDVSPSSPAHIQLAPGQTYNTVLRVYQPVTIYVNLQNSSNGSTYAGNATVSVSCSNSAYSICASNQAYSYTGSQLTITSLNSQQIVPNLDYTVSVSGGFLATAVTKHATSSWASDSSSTFTLSGSVPGSLKATVTWGGTAVSGASVRVQNATLGIDQTQTTDATGQYTFTNLPAGSGYTVTATKSGQSASATNQTVTGGTTTTVPLAFPTATLTVTVTWASVATAGILVTLSGGPMSLSARTGTTNASGQYAFTNLPVGSGYTVTASNITNSAVTLASTGTTVTLNLPNETLTVTVKNTSGVPQGGATVTVTGGPISGFSTSGTTASSNYASTITGTTGLVSYWRLGEAGPISNFSTDSFTGTTGTTLASHTGETGATWAAYSASGTTALLTDANRLRRNGNATAAYYSSGTPPSADYSVQADIVVKSLLTSDTAGVIGRATAATGTSTYYFAQYSVASAGWQLEKSVSGTVTQLGSTYAQTLTAGSTYTLTLELLGSSIRLLVNGTDVIRVTDTSITTAGRAGIRVGGTTTTGNTLGLHLDNFAGIRSLASADSKGTTTGTYMNAPGLGASGAIVGDANTSAQFDGVRDYVSVARNISDDFSIEFWFASTNGLNLNSQWWGNAGLVDGEVGGSSADFGVSLRSDGKITAGTGNPDTSILSASSGFDDGAWHQVVFTRQKTTGALRLYVDGSLEGSATSTNVSSLTAPTYLNFGRIQTGNSYFTGWLDEVAAYSVVLSSTTVSSHYSAGTGTNVGVVSFTLPSGNGFTATANAAGKTGSWTGSVTSNTSATVTVS